MARIIAKAARKTSNASQPSYGSSSGGRVVHEGADGNAPSGTKVGDTVVTAGGDYKVVAPNTAGANYNPSNGLWSVKETAASSGGASSGGSSYSGGSSGGGRVVQEGTDGNAPAGTQVGDTVVTAGGSFKVVQPNTPGASYNPASGLWSVKTATPQKNNGVNNSGSSYGYTSAGNYNDKNAGQDSIAAINSAKDSYEKAKANGDAAGMAYWHQMAEQERAKLGYSGGEDGSQYIPIDMGEMLPNKGLPVYEPQEGKVNGVYDKAMQNVLAALESSYNKSKEEAAYQMKKIPAVYQNQANAIGAQAEKQKHNFNEMASYSGMNAGSGSQAALAMSTQLQGNLGSLRQAEGNAIADAQRAITNLHSEYQAKVAEAIASNEYERALAVLAEYQKYASSVVETARDEASLDLDIFGINQNTNRYNEETKYNRALELAESLAKFGIFTGYKELGWSDQQIANARNTWLAMNPNVAWAL